MPLTRPTTGDPFDSGPTKSSTVMDEYADAIEALQAVDAIPQGGPLTDDLVSGDNKLRGEDDASATGGFVLAHAGDDAVSGGEAEVDGGDGASGKPGGLARLQGGFGDAGSDSPASVIANGGDGSGGDGWVEVVTHGQNGSTGEALMSDGSGGVAWDTPSATFTDLDIPTSTSPAQTTEGRAVWDSDDDVLTVGTGSGRKTIVNRADSVTVLNQNTGKLLGRSSASAGAVEEITVGTNLTLSGGTLDATGGADAWTEIVKSADQDVTNSAVLTADSELTFSMAAGKSYVVDFFIFYSGDSTAADYTFQFQTPGVAASPLGHYTVQTGAAGVVTAPLGTGGPPVAWPGATVLCDTSSTHAAPRYLHGRLLVTNDTGSPVTLGYYFCQNVQTSGKSARTRAGSMLRYRSLP